MTRPFASAPRTLVWLLAAVVLILAIQAIFVIKSVAAFLWAFGVAALSVSALFGNRRLAVALKYLLYFMGAMFAFVAVTGTAPVTDSAREFVVAVLLLVVARYLGSSKDVASFYGEKPAAAPVNG